MAHASLVRQPHHWARLLACFAIASAAPAFAIALGDMAVTSSLGEPLDASVALAPGQGEAVARECFTLGRGAAGAAPFFTRANLALETGAGGTRLRIRSTAPIGDPAITLRINAACPRGASPVSSDYVVLLDPQSGRGPLIVAPIPVAARAAPAPAPAPKAAATAPTPEPRPSKPAPATVPAVGTPTPAPIAAPSAATGEAFALKLSAPQLDLARARGVTDQVRAQLRERRAILDAEDPVASTLALRGSVKALEGRVAELQSKISTMATSPPAVATPAPEPVKVAPPPEAPAPRIEVPVAKVEPAPSAPSPPSAPKVEPPPPESAPLRPETRPSSSQNRPLPDWLWGVVALLVLIVAWIGLRLMRRSDTEPEYETEESVLPEIPALDEGHVFDEPPFGHAPPPVAEAHFEPAGMASSTAFAPEPPPPRPPLARRTMDSDASLQTSVSAGDPSDLRRRYIEERFPEIVARTIVLDESDSIVKGARLFYEDGAVSRAVELMQFAIEEKPGEVKRWLALFEIFRLERLTAEFNELASRFREYHGTSDFWAKVQFFGREIDPSNALYQEESFNDIETVGMPASARKVQALAFDPLAENWLNAPMDFSSEVLATEMRQKLLGQAGIAEAELIPNPMPALKNVEMFTVA